MQSKYVTEEMFNRRFDELIDIISSAFTDVHAEIGELQSDMRSVKHTLNALDSKLTRHLEISDDQYHELKSSQKKHEQWFRQLSSAGRVKLDPPIS